MPLGKSLDLSTPQLLRLSDEDDSIPTSWGSLRILNDNTCEVPGTVPSRALSECQHVSGLPKTLVRSSGVSVMDVGLTGYLWEE